jgi:hypothetical protein
MSMPDKVILDNIDPELALINVVASIVLQELGISHILNAEGEKLQAVINSPDVTTDQITDVNNSVEGVVSGVAELENYLVAKLRTTINPIPITFSFGIAIINKNGDPVIGGRFILYNYYVPQSIFYGISTDGFISFGNVPEGTYILKEDFPPYGYLPDFKSSVVVINSSGVITVDDIQINEYAIVREDGEISISIKKVDSATAQAVQGSSFTVYDGDKAISTSSSDECGNVKIVLDETVFGEFILREDKVPAGYQAMSDKAIKISPLAGWNIDGVSPSVSGCGWQYVIADLPFSHYVAFRTINQFGGGVPCAEFVLSDDRHTYCAVSDCDGYVNFGVLPEGNYTLCEVVAPLSYTQDTNVYYIHVSENGGVFVFDERSQSYKRLSGFNIVNEFALEILPGKILTPGMTGDGEWISIARCGYFTLIIRRKPISNGLRSSYKYSSYTNNNYCYSNVNEIVNNWYLGLNGYRWGLHQDARLRLYAVGSSVVCDMCDLGSVGSGYSEPADTYPYTPDTAFVLSAAEAYQYLSQSLYLGGDPNNRLISNAIAQHNFCLLEFNKEGKSTGDMWLRSPWQNDYASVLTSNGDIHSRLISNFGSIYPAMWVNSNIFL